MALFLLEEGSAKMALPKLLSHDLTSPHQQGSCEVVLRCTLKFYCSTINTTFTSTTATTICCCCYLFLLLRTTTTTISSSILLLLLLRTTTITATVGAAPVPYIFLPLSLPVHVSLILSQQRSPNTALSSSTMLTPSTYA